MLFFRNCLLSWLSSNMRLELILILNLCKVKKVKKIHIDNRVRVGPRFLLSIGAFLVNL